MQDRQIQTVSGEEWLAARKALLAKEKEFTRLRDQLSRERRSLPWTKVEKNYTFDTDQGKATLGDLFAGRHQLLVYHFMFGPDWEEGCPSCSFWADNFNGVDIHLQQRDINLIAVSRTSLEKIHQYRRRMGWQFTWVSSLNSDFNRDYQVSFAPEDRGEDGVYYNYRKTPFPSDEAPGISVFYRDDQGQVFHTYSCYSRGLDIVNGAYHMMDLTPRGRDEDELSFPMAWVKRRDQY